MGIFVFGVRVGNMIHAKAHKLWKTKYDPLIWTVMTATSYHVVPAAVDAWSLYGTPQKRRIWSL